METFDNWKPIWRWLLFLPMLGIVYFLFYVLNMLSIGWFLGPYDESSIINFLIYRFYFDTIGLGVSVVASSLCIPKGKIILASIYLGFIILFLGFMGYVILFSNSYYPTWKLIYSGLTLLTGGIGALVYVVIATTEGKRKGVDMSL